MMGLELAKNPLKIKQIAAEREEDINCAWDLAAITRVLADKLPQPALAVIWQRHRISWGRWQEGKLSLADGSVLEPAYIEELRVFNAAAELRLCRQGEGLQGRFVRDSEGASTKCVDSLSRFWGEKKAVEAGYVTLRDADRKLTLTIPCDEAADARWYGLITRSYVGVNEHTHQAGYADYRYMGIASAEEE